jgi:hypothetical protein
MVGLGGLEPPTSPLSGARSSHLSYRPFLQRRRIVYHGVALVQDANLRSALRPFAANFPQTTFILLHKPHIWWLATSFRRLFDRPELRFVARDILSQRPPDALRVSGTDNHAAQQLALRAVREDVNKIEREFLDTVVQHHQIAVLPL